MRRLNKVEWAAVVSAVVLTLAISLVTSSVIFLEAVRRQQRPSRGSDLQYNMELTLEEAVRGVTKEIRIPTLETCDVCHGNGAKPGTSADTCSTCHGMGQVHMRQGFFSVQQPCPTCHGRGKVIKDPCNKCHGHGRVERYKTLSVKIPAGVDTGDRVRLSGEGE